MTVAAIVGGGFYGAMIALYLKRQRGFGKVVLLERSDRLMSRGSFTNQARVHQGYHYPRSFTTAYRSVQNAPRFEREFAPAVKSDFVKLYAIARRNSKVTVRQMERFCREIGASLSPATADYTRLFERALVAAVYFAREHAFDADIVRGIVATQLAEAGVEIRFGFEVADALQDESGVTLHYRRGGQAGRLRAAVAFNCTYSRLHHILGAAEAADSMRLKHEISEMALVEPPPELADIGVTLMDGPFFSMMPFPARGLHSLSHVRYTPHAFWQEDGSDPYQRLSDYDRVSRADRMIRDAARYMPAIARVRPRDTLFEVKTVLVKNEGDDGRPILLHRHQPHGRLFSVLGGKIDNIYDVLEKLDDEALPDDHRNSEWTR